MIISWQWKIRRSFTQLDAPFESGLFRSPKFPLHAQTKSSSRCSRTNLRISSFPRIAKTSWAEASQKNPSHGLLRAFRPHLMLEAPAIRSTCQASTGKRDQWVLTSAGQNQALKQKRRLTSPEVHLMFIHQLIWLVKKRAAYALP